MYLVQTRKHLRIHTVYIRTLISLGWDTSLVRTFTTKPPEDTKMKSPNHYQETLHSLQQGSPTTFQRGHSLSTCLRGWLHQWTYRHQVFKCGPWAARSLLYSTLCPRPELVNVLRNLRWLKIIYSNKIWYFTGFLFGLPICTCEYSPTMWIRKGYWKNGLQMSRSVAELFGMNKNCYVCQWANMTLQLRNLMPSVKLGVGSIMICASSATPAQGCLAIIGRTMKYDA